MSVAKDNIVVGADGSVDFPGHVEGHMSFAPQKSGACCHHRPVTVPFETTDVNALRREIIRLEHERDAFKEDNERLIRELADVAQQSTSIEILDKIAQTEIVIPEDITRKQDLVPIAKEASVKSNLAALREMEYQYPISVQIGLTIPGKGERVVEFPITGAYSEFYVIKGVLVADQLYYVRINGLDRHVYTKESGRMQEVPNLTYEGIGSTSRVTNADDVERIIKMLPKDVAMEATSQNTQRVLRRYLHRDGSDDSNKMPTAIKDDSNSAKWFEFIGVETINGKVYSRWHCDYKSLADTDYYTEGDYVVVNAHIYVLGTDGTMEWIFNVAEVRFESLAYKSDLESIKNDTKSILFEVEIRIRSGIEKDVIKKCRVDGLANSYYKIVDVEGEDEYYIKEDVAIGNTVYVADGEHISPTLFKVSAVKYSALARNTDLESANQKLSALSTQCAEIQSAIGYAENEINNL